MQEARGPKFTSGDLNFFGPGGECASSYFWPNGAQE